MKTEYKITKSLIILFAFAAMAFAPASAIEKTQEQTGGKGFFDLVSLAEAFLSIETVQKTQTDLKIQQKEDFEDAIKRFSQGNITVAYDEYLSLIMNMKNDFALLNLAKSLYESGFFSLAELALSKVNKQDALGAQIEDLKHSYATAAQLSKEEEIYLAKAYSSIYFDNCPQETAWELNKKTTLMEKSDYANYLLSQSMFEMRQYQQALNYVENAISKNPKNSSYIVYKAKILIYAQDYRGALKHIEKNEKNISQNFKIALKIQKHQALANLSKDDKKFHLGYIDYLEGNNYKAIKTCQNPDKKGYQAYALLGKAYLRLGNYQEAVRNFEASYKINKNYSPALEGLGDMEFLNERYQESLEYYKKAFSKDPQSVSLALKLALASKMSKDPKDGKNSQKYESMAQRLDGQPFFEEYEIATTLLAGDLKEEYLRKSLSGSMFFENNWYEIIKMALDGGKTDKAKNILYVTYFINAASAERYYSVALVCSALGETGEAIANAKYAISLNPDFEDANKLLERLAGKGEVL